MNTILFPHSYKRWSGIIFYTAVLVGLYFYFFDDFDDYLVVRVFNLFPDSWTFSTEYTENIVGIDKHWVKNGVLDELLTVLMIVFGIVNSFSKEKHEDELIAKLRMDSLTTSLYINYSILLIATLVIFDVAYFNVMIFNLFTIILFFNLIFKYKLYKHYKS